MMYIMCIIVSYLLGSVPFGLVVAKLVKNVDLRTVGSGNIGATNVMRVGGLRIAGLVWILDMVKAIIAVLLGKYIGGDVFAIWCGFSAIVGHCFPIWLNFRGGKGISSLFGIFLAINPFMFVICGIEWLLGALGTGYSSFGAVIVFCLAPVLGFCMNFGIGIGFVAISLLCFVRHRQNILRLLSGEESKIKWKWKK